MKLKVSKRCKQSKLLLVMSQFASSLWMLKSQMFTFAVSPACKTHANTMTFIFHKAV